METSKIQLWIGCIYTTLLFMGCKNKNTYFNGVREEERKSEKREMGERGERIDFVYIILISCM